MQQLGGASLQMQQLALPVLHSKQLGKGETWSMSVKG